LENFQPGHVKTMKSMFERKILPSMVVHTYNPSIREAEIGGS
jgi:hypothetical protein